MSDTISPTPSGGDFKKSLAEQILLQLRLWSLLILPIVGFLIGRICRWMFNTWFVSLGGPVLAHLVTMIFMIAVLNDLVLGGRVRDPKDTMIFIVFGYLSVLGILAGLVIP
jgi:hypothetical protein